MHSFSGKSRTLRQSVAGEISDGGVMDETLLQTAVGGNVVSEVLQRERRYDLVLRYLEPYRDTNSSQVSRSGAHGNRGVRDSFGLHSTFLPDAEENYCREGINPTVALQ
jgi:cobalt-zinc-cadmium resistance protein CzcA